MTSSLAHKKLFRGGWYHHPSMEMWSFHGTGDSITYHRKLHFRRGWCHPPIKIVAISRSEWWKYIFKSGWIAIVNMFFLWTDYLFIGTKFSQPATVTPADYAGLAGASTLTPLQHQRRPARHAGYRACTVQEGTLARGGGARRSAAPARSRWWSGRRSSAWAQPSFCKWGGGRAWRIFYGRYPHVQPRHQM